MAKQKILIFSIAYAPLVGGAEVAVKEITDRLPDYDFDLICAKIKKNLPSYEKIGNVNVYRVGAGIARIDKFFFPMTGFLKALFLRKNRPQMVWAVIANYAGLAGLFFKLTHKKIPFLLTLQEGDSEKHILKRVGIFYPLWRLIFLKADYIQAISRYLADWAKKIGASCSLKVVPNGVDVKKFETQCLKDENDKLKKSLGIKENEKVIITTSRLVEKNAVDDLIKSIKELKIINYELPVKLLILGTGEKEKALKSLTKDLELEEKIIFLGHISHDELPKYLAISDIFVRPSLSEGLGNSFLEAMAVGVPVIGTPVGGIPDFLEDGKTGLFCQPKNPKNIADKIKLLLSDDNLRQNIIENGYKLVKEKYDWDMIAREMNDIFNNLNYGRKK